MLLLGMHILKGSEDTCSILTWADDIQHVITGLGITDPVPAYMLYTQCMCGTALSTFKVIVRTRCASARATALAAAADDPAHEGIQNRTDASFFSLTKYGIYMPRFCKHLISMGDFLAVVGHITKCPPKVILFSGSAVENCESAPNSGHW
jgi:hypothetical protein